MLKKIYQTSTIVAIPSRYEGFGLATIEAFEMNKPIVASNVEALTESLKDEYNALLVTPKDPKALAKALERLAANRDLQQKLVTNGQKTLERIKSQALKDAWLELYDSVYQDSRPPETRRDKGT